MFGSTHSRLVALASLLALPYVLGLFFPESWWGTHFATFLPAPWHALAVVLPVAIIAATNLYASGWQRTLKLPKSVGALPPYFLALAAGILFYQFPIVEDFYGNARSFRSVMHDPVTSLPDGIGAELLSFKFEPGNGRRGVYLFYSWLAHQFGQTPFTIFRWMGAIGGALYATIWLLAVRRFLKDATMQFAFGFLGLCAPFVLIWFGHIDTYALLYALVPGWWPLLFRYLKSGKAIQLVGLILLLVLGIRMHTLMYLHVPALLLAIGYKTLAQAQWAQRLFNLRTMLLAVFAPAMLIGILGYFFVWKDYNDPRVLENFVDSERLFLPLFSPEAPWDRYNLLSWNHLFDFANAAFIWSPAALFLLGCAVLLFRTHINWNGMEVVLPLLSIGFYCAFLFAFNPLMSMPMDWDVFVFPALILLPLLLQIFSRIELKELNVRIAGTAIGLALLCTPIFVVHARTDSSSYRLEAVGKHVFKTYYGHADTYLLYALQLIPNDPELYLQRKNQILDELKPHAIKGRDPKYALLLMDNAIMHLQAFDQPEIALRELREATEYDAEVPGLQEVKAAAEARLQN